MTELRKICYKTYCYALIYINMPYHNVMVRIIRDSRRNFRNPKTYLFLKIKHNNILIYNMNSAATYDYINTFANKCIKVKNLYDTKLYIKKYIIALYFDRMINVLNSYFLLLFQLFSVKKISVSKPLYLHTKMVTHFYVYSLRCATHNRTLTWHSTIDILWKMRKIINNKYKLCAVTQ